VDCFLPGNSGWLVGDGSDSAVLACFWLVSGSAHHLAGEGLVAIRAILLDMRCNSRYTDGAWASGENRSLSVCNRYHNTVRSRREKVRRSKL